MMHKMPNRTSCVDHIDVNSVAFSSIIQIGDSTIVNGFSRALAVHRETEVFYTNEGNFQAYRVFTQPLPFIPVNEAVTMEFYHHIPIIKVGKIDIIGISSSSLFQVGSSRNVSMETRVKHIRQLLNSNEEQMQGR